MSKLSDLIAQLCPHGVEFKTLGEVTKVLRGRRLTREQLSDKGKFPVFHGGLEPLGFYSKSNRPLNSVMIINVGASAGTVGFCDKDFWSSDGCFTLENKNNNSRYLYYAIMCQENFLKSRVRKAGIPTLDGNVIENLKIPVPPLEVQKEIVRILDKFTELIEKLSEELSLRKKQYEFYREKLLTFGSEVEFKKLGDICKNRTERNKGKKCNLAYSITKNGLVPTENYFKGAKVTSDDTSSYKIVKKNWFVYSPSRIDVGSINFLKDVDEIIVSPLDVVFSVDEKKILPEFLLHYLLSHDGMFQILNHRRGIEGTGRKMLPFENFAKIKIPIPPIEEQERIVKILDRFDKLCNDLSEGLPAEILLRKKQYEYYRDKLLTFEEKI